MGTMQWLSHFRDSATRERSFDFAQGVTLEPAVREPVMAALSFFQRALSTPGMDLRTKVRNGGSPEYVECVDLYVAEKNAHADLLARVLWAAGEQPGRRNVPDFVFRRVRRRLPWQPEIMVLLTAELVMVPVLRVIANHTRDPLVTEVVESILYDQSFHIGFHLDHLRDELRGFGSLSNVGLQAAWSAMFTSALTVLLRECHGLFDAIGYSRLTCWTDAWHLFSTVQAGLHGSDHLNSVIGRDSRIRFAI